MVAPVPSWNTVRIYGTWRNLDGTLKAGSYKVTFPQRVTNATDDVIVPAGTFAAGQLSTAPDAAPSLDFQCPATDDPDNTPNGWQVTITVSFSEVGVKSETYVIDVPLAAAQNGINLRTVTPIDSLPPAPSPQPIPLALDGLAFVNHGENAVASRPTAVAVIWAGTVQPLNMNLDYDLWVGPEGA